MVKTCTADGKHQACKDSWTPDGEGREDDPKKHGGELQKEKGKICASLHGLKQLKQRQKEISGEDL